MHEVVHFFGRDSRMLLVAAVGGSLCKLDEGVSLLENVVVYFFGGHVQVFVSIFN